MTNPTPTMEEVIAAGLAASITAPDEPIVPHIAQALRQARFIHRSEVLSDEAVERAVRAVNRVNDRRDLKWSEWIDAIARAALLAALGEEEQG